MVDEVTKTPGPEMHNLNDTTYRVEVRAKTKPVQFGNELIGNHWTRLPTVRVHPHGTSYRDRYDDLTGTENYWGALALAASAMSGDPWSGVEVRIVEYRRTISYQLERGEETLLPDWIDRLFATKPAGHRKEESA